MLNTVQKISILLSLVLVGAKLSADPIDVTDLQKKLHDAKVTAWKAAKNKLTELSAEQRKRLVGGESEEANNLKPLRSKKELNEEELAKLVSKQGGDSIRGKYKKLGADPDHEQTLDWRFNGLSAVKNQGSCGSCVPFATSNTTQDQLSLRTHARAGTIISPQFIFSCTPGTCAGGTIFQNAADFIRDTGVVSEGCSPYTSGGGQDAKCTACEGWQNEAIRFNHNHWDSNNSTIENLMEVLSTQGPVLSTMTVYDDFFAYSSGVYSHATGNWVGGHGVEIVGYSQPGRFWIARNSWGDTWGEAGYFNISWDDSASGVGRETWQFWPAN